jgi:hypothetical protein
LPQAPRAAERRGDEPAAHERSRRAAKVKPVGSSGELDSPTVLLGFPNDEEQSGHKDCQGGDHNPDH